MRKLPKGIKKTDKIDKPETLYKCALALAKSTHQYPLDDLAKEIKEGFFGSKEKRMKEIICEIRKLSNELEKIKDSETVENISPENLDKLFFKIIPKAVRENYANNSPVAIFFKSLKGQCLEMKKMNEMFQFKTLTVGYISEKDQEKISTEMRRLKEKVSEKQNKISFILDKAPTEIPGIILDICRSYLKSLSLLDEK